MIGLLFVVPFGFLIYQSFHTADGFSTRAYTDLFSAGNIFTDVVVRTAWIAVLVALLTLLLGYPIAYAAVRLPKLWSGLLLTAVVLPFFTAALVRTYAWQVLLANNGPINEFLLSLGVISAPLKLVYNDIGVVIGTTQVLLPMMVFPLYSVMRRIDRSGVLAAQSMGAHPLRAWLTVFVPQTGAGIASGLSLVFLSTLGYFITPMLLQGPATPMLAQRIFSLISLPGQSATVAAQATLVLIASVICMYVLRKRLGIVLEAPSEGSPPRSGLRGVRDKVRNVQPFRDGIGVVPGLGRVVDYGGRLLSAIRYPALAVLVVFGVALLLAPMVVIVAVAFSDSAFLTFPPPAYSTRWFEWYFNNDAWLGSTWLSFWMSIIGATIATIVGSLAAFGIVRSTRRTLSTTGYLLLAAPLVMPQIIFATALFYTVAPTGLLGTPAALILSYIVLGIPFVVIIMTATFRGLDPALERAATSMGAKPPVVARTVIVPLVMPAIFGALLFAFITAFDDLVMSQFLGSFSVVTLMRRLFENILFEVSPAVASVGVLLIGFVATLGAVAYVLTRLRSRTVNRSLPEGA
ncbi:ABC transporter permease subunit [Ornithinimicrobium sufpigmenti]|uniref:ABC transporter permease subunit n=1 Tax=Ornithinimicrobium sufpigmenti TaxID=2508882 RepID=UPI0015E16D74|nr:MULTISPECIES: ABC transporter permease subunit [unclassified Ornithinimicrobium]